jgi:hypothetical protein
VLRVIVASEVSLQRVREEEVEAGCMDCQLPRNPD